MSKVPLYQGVYQKIKNLIRSGEYGVGELLPPEGELEKQYEVSRTTIRKVIEMLVAEGYIEVKQGRGTRVLDFHSTQKLNGITSITETLRKRGMIVRSRGVYVDVIEANIKIAERLQIQEGDEIFRVQRVVLADEIPIAIMENYISCELAPDLVSKTTEIKSLYEFLEGYYHLQIDAANDIISAKSAEFSEAQILDVRISAALLTLRRVTFMQGKPVTYDKVTIRADKYQFEIELQGRN